MRWRLGDGESIKIYNDNWLPDSGSAKVVSPCVPALEGANVDFMINPDTGTWDFNLIDQHFLWFEAQWIKAIPLCVSRQVDIIIWPRCKNGEYSLKTGYQRFSSCVRMKGVVMHQVQKLRIKRNSGTIIGSLEYQIKL